MLQGKKRSNKTKKKKATTTKQQKKKKATVATFNFAPSCASKNKEEERDGITAIALLAAL
jgi:hypothetical protein